MLPLVSQFEYTSRSQVYIATISHFYKDRNPTRVAFACPTIDRRSVTGVYANLFQGRQRKTEPLLQVSCTENLVKFGMWFPRYASVKGTEIKFGKLIEMILF